jgi:hypothetical protein
MNLSYRQRSFHKTDLTVNYTLARAVGYDQDGGSFRYYPRDPQKPFAPAEFGPSFNDERHHLTIAGTSHLPFGLEASPILQFGSARPFLPASGSNMLNLGGGSAAGALVVTNANPKNLLSGTQLAPVIDSVSNVSSIVLAASKCYYSGGCQLAAYSGLRGDPYFNMDARLAKNIKLGESRNLQLIFQAFNLFNHANYGNNFGFTTNEFSTVPDTARCATCKKQISTADSTFSNPVGFINPSSSLLPRAFTAEFGARFSF